MYTHILVAVIALPHVHAASWDDFSNNLATDLAPFLSLFGEQITKQYLSESVTPLDYFIFAMAPMGILTAVVSAIRVCGSPSLRAFIGRAQEGAGNAEAELCSSTSRDVCELYNNGGIARVFGRPKILEVVHDPDHNWTDDETGMHPETAGIYTFEEYVQGKGKDLWHKRLPNKEQKDTESAPEAEHPTTTYAPNLSLNIGIKKQSGAVFWVIALGGLALQAGVLVFAVVVTYYLKWEKSGSHPESYACPLAVLGTLLVCGGMFYCAFLVGQSTDEEVWHRTENDMSSMYWIQPGDQIIGDQTFNAFCHSECNDPRDRLKEYTISRRRNRPVDSEFAIWFAVSITISGFVLQFTGLRGIHSTVSVAQLGATIVMSTARAALRMQRLKPDANAFANIPDEIRGHELDWLAIRIGRNNIQNDLFNPPSSSSSVSVSSSLSSALSAPNPRWRYFWIFCGAPDPVNRIRREHPPPHGFKNAAASLLAYRTRLAGLTYSSPAPARDFKIEMVEVRRESEKLAQVIEATVNAIFPQFSKAKVKVKGEWEEAQSIYWGINCTVSCKPTGSFGPIKDSTIPRKQHTVYLRITRENDSSAGRARWRLQNRLELEGLLGLWVWSLKSDPATEVEDPETHFTRSEAAEVPLRRIVSTDPSFTESDLGIWLGGESNGLNDHTLHPTPPEYLDASAVWEKTDSEKTWKPLSFDPQRGPPRVRFFGWDTAQLPSRDLKSFSLWSAPIDNSLLSACAQEVFVSFLTSVLDIVEDTGSIEIQEPEPFRLHNSLVAEIVELFTEMQLGSRQEALLCVVPTLISRLKMSFPESALTAVWKVASQHRRQREWEKAEAILRWAWNICTASRPSDSNTVNQDENQEPITKHAPAEQATVALCELYRWAMMDDDKKDFGINGIKELEGKKTGQSESTCQIIDRYVAVANGVQDQEVCSVGLREATEKGCLTAILLALTRLSAKADREQKRDALYSATKHEWFEVVLALLELGAEPDFRDEPGRTPLSYAAEKGSVAILRELIEWGGFPNSEDAQHRTPLSYAAESGAEGAVELLLRDPRVFPNVKDEKGKTPLWWAARYGREGAVDQLLANSKVDPDPRNRREATPLWTAACYGHDGIVKRLLATNKVDPNAKNERGETPLLQAARRGHEVIVDRLLATDKVDPDARDKLWETPLSQAVKYGYERIVKRLLATNKVDPDAKRGNGDTPLTRAACRGYEGIVRQLLATNKVNLNAKRWGTPLYFAADGGHIGMVDQLLATNKVDLDAKDDHGETPLKGAATRGHERIVERLLATNKVDPDAKNHYGETPLWGAASCGYEGIVRRLLETDKVDPNAQNERGETPLIVAAMHGHKAMVQQLLATNKVDPDVKDRTGRTASEWAALYNPEKKSIMPLRAEERCDAYGCA